ncbi:MAG TPA: metallophosphoesterase, partial [Chitinophagaceae bacterium]
MSFSRRDFLKLTLRSAVVIGAGNSLQSFAANNFDLPSRDKIRLRFAVASDGHYGQPDTQYEPYHDEMISWINTEHKTRGINFTVINGDLFHNDINFLPQVKQKWDQLQMHYYVTHGNHDQTDESNWQKTWNMPWHFVFEEKDATFLVLNTADDKGQYICPDINWTKEQFSRYQSKKSLFIFMHITPFSWTKNGLPCPELVELFDKQNNLKAIFHGHDHDQDNVKEHNNKYYFFDSHVASNWGTLYRGYRIVEILKSGDILTYQMNPFAQQRVNINRV